jgi:hypothetical protein
VVRFAASAAPAASVALVGACAGALLLPARSSAWTRPTRLSGTFLDTGNGDQLTQAINPFGDAVVAWTDQIDAYHSVVQARLRIAGGPWGRLQDLRLPGDPDGDDPSVAIDRAGDAIAVWDGQTTHRGAPNTDDPELEVAEAMAGHKFGHPALLTSPDLLGKTYPFAGFDAAGQALVIWSDETHVWYAVRDPHGRFSRPAQIENPNTSPADDDVQRPVYALGADGSAVVAWYYYGGVYAAYRPAGRAFGEPRELNPATATAETDSAPLVAIDAHGRALVGWTGNMESYTADRIVIAASRRGSSGETTFTPPETVLDRALLGGLAMDDAGEATIVGQGDALPDAAGVAVVRSPDGALSPPESLGPAAKGPIYGVFGVAYDPAGDVFATWRHLDSLVLDDTYGEVYVEERPAGRRFTGTPISVSGDARDPFDPLVATGPPGDATIVWPTTPRDLSTEYIAASDRRGRPG